MRRYASCAVPETTPTGCSDTTFVSGAGRLLSPRTANRAGQRKYGRVARWSALSAAVSGIAAATTSPWLAWSASSSVSKRRTCTVQVRPSFSQAARASSTAKPVGLPSGPAKCSGGYSSSVRKRIGLVVCGGSGRSSRARGFQKFGIITASAAAAGTAASISTAAIRPCI